MNIPSLPIEKLIDKTDGDFSATGRQFFDLLVNELQTNAGQEGLVAPSQPTANITIIQNNQLENGAYTAQGGQLVYDSDTNQLKVVILSGGIPTFKVVQVV